jgi:GT2 family glycosyltransferase
MQLAAQHQAPEVAFIIPCYNSSSTLPLCLHSILNQEPPAPVEVIVADSSDDGSSDSMAMAFPEVRFLRSAVRTNPAAARNRGIAVASAPLCAFVDADVVLAKDWLARATAALTDERQGVCGSIAPYPEKNLLGFCHFLIQFSKFLPAGRPQTLEVIPSYAFLVRREEVLKAGGFPEGFPMLEDFLFSRRLTEKAKRLFLFCPDMRAFHINRKHWGVIASQLRNHGLWSARARREAPLPGVFLGKYPAAVPLLVPYRLVLILARTFQWDGRSFCRALALSPVLLTGLSLWAAAFYRGAVEGHDR